MYPYFEILNLKLPAYQLMLLLAVIFGGLCLRRIFLKLGFDKYLYMIVLIISLVSGSTGSHIFSLIEIGNYKQIFSSNLFHSGMNFLGGLLLTVLVIFIFLRFYRKISFVELSAAFSLPLILGYSIGRIGCFLAGDGCYGIQTNLPWGMSFPNGIFPTFLKVHPTPIYESLFCLLLFIILMKNFNYEKFYLIKYKIIFIALIGYGLERFFVEFIRRNTVFYGLTQAQWISLFLIIIAIPLIWKYFSIKKMETQSLN